MYVGALLVVVGTALWTGSLVVLAYAGLVFAALHAFVVGYEEPRLQASFGASYARFRDGVPRWLPRWPTRSRQRLEP
jgi:protein-S-isoprenylcysteine O-methyltransferase Ste14